MPQPPKDKPESDRSPTAGSFGTGQSGGGAYATPHGTAADKADKAKAKAKGAEGGQSVQGYYGGGQAGADTGGGGDHHAASRRDAPDDAAATYRDHPSQQGGKARADFDTALDRGVANRSLEGEALEPGDRVQGSDGRPVTGKP